jgi:putative sigma-54 modulation protein
MQIEIQSDGFALTLALGEYAKRRLRFALAYAGGRVRRVAVRLADVNGPRGRIDKRCRIRVTLNGLAAVVIEDAEADLYRAIDRAADRVGRTVARRMARHGAHSAEADDRYHAAGAAATDR